MKDTNLHELEERLGYRFRDRALLEHALIHPSYAAEQKRPPPTNQRLEFLGDAVLQLCLSALLYEQFADAPEGQLTILRAALCNESTLAHIAARLGIGDFVRLGHGEERTGGRNRPSILADTFEAVLAAVFLDGGYETAFERCSHWFAEDLENADALLLAINPKGALQEWTQAHRHETPVYRVLGVSGPDHAPEFEVAVFLGEEELARASGRSRREAEKAAARAALERLERSDREQDDDDDSY